MTDEEDSKNKTGLVPSHASALSLGGTLSLASRGLKDRLAREDAEQWYKRGLYLWDEERYEEAVPWFRKAADQGVADAQAFLGWIYQYWWRHSDYSIAAAWYFLAAEQGNVAAAFELGKLYEIGQGVRRDPAHAEAYYRQAAERGHEQAKQALDEMHRN
jgi:TPR repeat protein